MTRISDPIDSSLPTPVALAFAPLHKRAFGTAIGLAAALVMLAVNVVALARGPHVSEPLILLSEYFYGYTVSWMGALVAAAWTFFVGFVAGWFVAFFRNLVLAVSLIAIRTRAEMSATRDFLDHI
jgi:hypothetical protein